MKISVREKTTLFDFLLDKLKPVSKTRVRKLIQNRHITLDGEVITLPDRGLAPGQVIEVRRPVPPPPFPVLYDDPYLIALEKPPGLLSISTKKEEHDTFYRAVNQYVQSRSNDRERIFIVHRLDREASGIMLFAKTPEIKRALQRDWKNTEKLYSALVEGHPPQREGTIRSWLKESPDLKVHSGPEGPGSKYAVTHYRLVKECPRHALLTIRLETGRKNQIRVHLSEMGCPVVGDKKYGASSNPFGRLALHAFSFSFTHPVSRQRIKLESPVPAIFFSIKKTICRAP